MSFWLWYTAIGFLSYMFGFNAIFGFNIISPSLSLVNYDNEFEMKGKNLNQE